MNDIKTLIKEGSELAESGKYREAELNFLKALQLDPNNTDVLSNMATLRVLQKRFDGALTYYERIVQIDPYDVDVIAHALFVLTRHCIWNRRDFFINSMKKAVNELPAFCTESFLMNLPHTFQELHGWLVKKAAGDAKLQDILSEKPFDHSAHKVGTKIKIGYFTTDVGASPCGFVLPSLWESHNHNDFEWHCFCFKDLSKDEKPFKKALIEREVKCFDAFHDMSKMEDEKQIAQKVYDEKIDIIIDVSMLTNEKCAFIFRNCFFISN